MALGETVNSLHPDSTSEYQTGQIRQCGPGKVRIQGVSASGNSWEETQAVSRALGKYIAARPHVGVSIAGTSTMYVECQFRQEGKTGYARYQIPGPELNRPWGAEFVLPLAHYKTLPAAPKGAPAATSPPTSPYQKALDGLVDAIFKVGDKVIFTKEGDGCDPVCGGGPAVGTQGVVFSVETSKNNPTCGTIRVSYGPHGDKWTTTAEHLALAVKEPSSFLAKSGLPGKHPAYMCANCGQNAGTHYSGGVAPQHFDPPLCPDHTAVCPICGPVGPQPMPIHKLVCPTVSNILISKLKSDSEEVPF